MLTMKKNTSKFNYEEIKLVEPDFNSPLTDLIIEHEHLRKRQLGGTTPAQIFFQLKSIFHFLESLGSLRLEGNHTTVDELIEEKYKKDEVRMVMQVHDELVFEIRDDLVNKISGEIQTEMETVHKFKVPIVADIGTGKNWGECK